MGSAYKKAIIKDAGAGRGRDVMADNGVPTKFIAWPVPAHNASDPVRQMEVSRLWIDWMDQHLQETKTY